MRSLKSSTYRRLSMLGFDAVVGGHNFFGLLEFDVSGLRKELRGARRAGEGGSLFAFFLKAVGEAVASEPVFNSFAGYRRITNFESVDISIPIEVSVMGRTENRQYVIRDIVHKSLVVVASEIEAAKANAEGASGFVKDGFRQKLIAALPRSFAGLLFKMVIRNHALNRKLSGTLFATSVSMVSSVPGFVIPFIGGPKAVSFAFGSVCKKPLVIGDHIEIREVASVTAIFNHDIVDGAPAGRLINKVRRLIEHDYKILIHGLPK